MNTIPGNTYQFLNKLKKNNNRDWFLENKQQYELIKNEFAAFLTDLIAGIATFDESISSVDPKKSIFRIYRDVRFSKDKTPYHGYIGAHLLAGGRKSEHAQSGYYIRLEPGNSFLAGGAHLPPTNWIKAIRNEIAHNADELKNILNNKDFKKYFGELEGESLKTAPRDYPKDHPEITLLKRKSFLAVHRLNDEDVLKEGFLKHSTNVFKAMHPFGNFLNRASEN